MILYKELSYKFIGCCYDVRNKYGKHHKEKVYHQALEEELRLKGISYKSKPRILIYSVTSGDKLTYYEPDFLIDGKLVIEIKAKPYTSQDNKMQLLEYLKTSTYEVAYLINFGEENFQPNNYRYIHTKDNKTFINKNRIN